MISILAIGIYLSVLAACLLAGHHARASGRPVQRIWHWRICGFLFAALAISRATVLEERLRDAMRTMLHGEALYADRIALQLPLFAILMISLITGALYAWKRWDERRKSRGRRLIWLAGVGCAGLILLSSLRIVSLHLTDKLLYSGPIRLNWVLDIGLSLQVGAAALFYIAYCRKLADRS